jgi:adenosylhomocysteinase
MRRGEVETPRGAALHAWGERCSIRARQDELLAILDALSDRLEADGWIPADWARPDPALAYGCREFRRGRETITICASPGTADYPGLGSRHEVSAIGLVASPAAVRATFARFPFSDLELEDLARDMPLTSAVQARASDWMPAIPKENVSLERYGAIFTIHHQTDFVLLLHRALDLGLERSLVTVIDKEYRYAHSRRVDAEITDKLRIPVFKFSEINYGISDHIRRVRAHQLSAKASTWLPTLVVDDGGYVLPCLHDRFPRQLSLFRGVVEQTKSGIWAVESFKSDLKLPLFSVAESDLKASVEAHGVAAGALTSLRRLIPNEMFEGRRAVVVGFGVIGKALAELLRSNRFIVTVAESSDADRVTAEQLGFEAYREPAVAIGRANPRFVFSCAGREAVDGQCFDAIRRDCFLVSLTSRDYAFRKADLDARYSSVPVGSIGTAYRSEGSPSLFLVADGFPVNFHFAESMPNQQSDLVMASLLVGALALANRDDYWAPGNDPERANHVLNAGTLLADFSEAEHLLPGDVAA